MADSMKSIFTVLVVDDDGVVRMFHEMLLKKLGFKVQLAKNGKEAVDLHLSGASFSLILMDMEMPIMNGKEATKQLRAMGVESPIVGVTSHTSESVKMAFMAAGLNDCVSKPLIVNQIACFLPIIGDNNCSSSSNDYYNNNNNNNI